MLLLVLVPIVGIVLRWTFDDLRWFQPGSYWRHILAALAILLAFEVFKESAWRRLQRGVHWARFAAGASAGLMVGVGYSPEAGGVLMATFIGIVVGLAFDLVVRE